VGPQVARADSWIARPVDAPKPQATGATTAASRPEGLGRFDRSPRR